MSLRRQSRELVLQVLFQCEFSQQIDSEKSFKAFCDHFEISSDVREYAETLLNGLKEKTPEIDAKIDGVSDNWKTQRMPLVDLNILRVSTFELLFLKEEIPPKVAINEAIEIARKYGTTDSAQFVNGVLDRIVNS